MKLWIVACTLLAVAGGANANEIRPRLSGPWPDAHSLDAIQGEAVTYPSRSPFSPADLGPSGEAPGATARATIFRPAGRHKPRSVPAVIMLHGSGGVLWAREMAYGKQLAAMGVAALVVDAFAARAEMGSGFIDRLLNITETMMLADAFAGLHFLDRHPEIDPDRVALIGFSYGAMASMYAMNARVAEQLGNGRRFAAHVAFYGPCIARFADKRTTGAPLLMLYGTADILIDRRRCDEVADDMRRGGSAVDIIGYEGAPHQWDGGWGRRHIGRNLAPCRIEVERDGTARDQRTLLPMSGPALRRIILGLCVENKPYLIGADDEVRARSNRDLGDFLVRALRLERR